ncbi:sensor histidine kinase [Paractinoplanes hotanensis]|uniref:Sensor histidine kinase n=1 Tax=Paractinoplanes hotanensis TaxID=2906497 RepID=A0ABT0YF52_9ACTN|nr:sensor histidine kinase [Actinoplanes hotanensis]MCM4084152.1 sensor histidine kinase [Actinoplanes hotanensis]
MTCEQERGDGTAHTALIVDSGEELLPVLVPELRRSAGRYDEILLVVGKETRTLLAEHIGELDGALRWGDPSAFYQRLGFAYESFRRYLAEQHAAGRRVHVVAEPDLTSGVDAGMRADRAAAYLAYEAFCNETYAPYGAAVTCIWNQRHHPANVLDGVRATHRYLLTAAGRVPSPPYLGPERYLAERHDLPLQPPPADIDHEVVLAEVAELSRLRAVLHSWTGEHHFTGEPADDVVVAVVEVAANGLRHGAAPVHVRAWHHKATFIVQCDDTAGRPIPATAGYRRPQLAHAAPGGRGLWLARQLADVVIIDSARGRTSVRLHFPYEVMHRSPA